VLPNGFKGLVTFAKVSKVMFFFPFLMCLTVCCLFYTQVQFDRYLASPDTLVMPQLNFLLSAAIKYESTSIYHTCFIYNTAIYN